jgi:hypothetical protein
MFTCASFQQEQVHNYKNSIQTPIVFHGEYVYQEPN